MSTLENKERDTPLEMVPAVSHQPKTEACACGIVFQGISKEELLQKIVQKSSGDKIPCETCVYRLTKTDSTNVHCCFVCNDKFRSETDLHNHLLIDHIPSAPYKCEDCDETFKLNILLKTHKRLRNCVKGESFTCHLCGKHYDRHYEFKDHMEVHKGDKHECPICQKKFLSTRRVKMHIRNSHEKGKFKVPRIECDVCQKLFAKSSLIVHKRKMHGTNGTVEKKPPKEFRCACGMKFSTLTGMNDHVNSNHTGDKPHVCKTCGKAFGNYLSFRRHQVIHTGVKKHKCDTCGVSFNQKCTLTRHQVVHTGEKPFECGICGQRFTQKPYMMAHKKKHKEGEVVTVKQKKKKQESSEESEEDMSEGEEPVTEDETSEESEELSD